MVTGVSGVASFVADDTGALGLGGISADPAGETGTGAKADASSATVGTGEFAVTETPDLEASLDGAEKDRPEGFAVAGLALGASGFCSFAVTDAGMGGWSGRS